MNVYEKIQKAKVVILESNLKKSGLNKFSKFSYFELSDLLPTIIKICDDLKLFTQISFTNDLAILRIINVEKSDEIVEYTSPMRDLELKGANSIQSLGGIETYSRRYLLLTAFDIIESDMFDCQKSNDEIKNYKCNDCGKPFESYIDQYGKTWTAAQIFHMSENKSEDKKARCKECRSKL